MPVREPSERANPGDTRTFRNDPKFGPSEQTLRSASGRECVGQGRTVGGFEHEEVARAADEGMVGEDQGAMRAERAVSMGAAIAAGSAASAGRNVEELFQAGVEAVAIRPASRWQITGSQERIRTTDDYRQAIDTPSARGWGKSAGVRRHWPR